MVTHAGARLAEGEGPPLLPSNITRVGAAANACAVAATAASAAAPTKVRRENVSKAGAGQSFDNDVMK